MPAPGPRSRGARVHPPPHQGLRTLARRSAASRLVLATQGLGGITGRGTRLRLARYPLRNWSFSVVQTIRIIGSGRVGSAVAARLRERGFALTEDEADLVLLCLPDRAIAEVAPAIPTGPWVAHTSGATPLSALAPHERRFGLHPLQSFTRARGPEQLDGAFAAIRAESDEAREVGSWLARQ